MKLPTASALDRARICPGSAVLPRASEVTPGMSAGSARHLYLQRANEVGAEAALAEIEDETTRSVCAAIALEGLPLDPAQYAAEVAFAYNPQTGQARELGRGLRRDYSGVGEHELAGTADVVCWIGEEGVGVLDWKAEWDTVPPPRQNLQLRFLALAACRAYGRTDATIEIIRPGEERAWRERATLDLFDLAETAEELRALVSRIAAGAATELVVGAHCKRCPSLRLCPAQGGLVRGMAGDGETALATLEQGLTPAMAAQVWHRLKAAEATLEKLWGSLEAYVTQVGGVELGDGRVYGPTTVRRESLVGPIAWRVLAERYDEQTAWSAAEVKVTKAALDRLVRARLEKGAKISHALRDLLGAIDAAGGLKVKAQEEVRVHKERER